MQLKIAQNIDKKNKQSIIKKSSKLYNELKHKQMKENKERQICSVLNLNNYSSVLTFLSGML